MACFGGPIAPEASAQWTKSQNSLVYPLVSALGQGIFGEKFSIIDYNRMTDKERKHYQQPGINQMYDLFSYKGKFSAGPSDLQNQYFQAAPQVAQQQLGQLSDIGSGQTQMNFANRFAQDVITPRSWSDSPGRAPRTVAGP